MWTIDADAKEEEEASGNPLTITNAKYDLRGRTKKGREQHKGLPLRRRSVMWKTPM